MQNSILRGILSRSNSRELEPQAGIMTARATYEKARSIRHCCQLAGPRRMSVEGKYDGEYCQIHIDLNKSGADIKIFSKSGRDSTSDRMGIHRALWDSLELDTAGCKIKKRCILEGELQLKKDYIPGLGDTADFVIIGGRPAYIPPTQLCCSPLIAFKH